MLLICILVFCAARNEAGCLSPQLFGCVSTARVDPQHRVRFSGPDFSRSLVGKTSKSVPPPAFGRPEGRFGGLPDWNPAEMRPGSSISGPEAPLRNIIRVDVSSQCQNMVTKWPQTWFTGPVLDAFYTAFKPNRVPGQASRKSTKPRATKCTFGCSIEFPGRRSFIWGV